MPVKVSTVAVMSETASHMSPCVLQAGGLTKPLGKSASLQNLPVS